MYFFFHYYYNCILSHLKQNRNRKKACVKYMSISKGVVIKYNFINVIDYIYKLASNMLMF